MAGIRVIGKLVKLPRMNHSPGFSATRLEGHGLRLDPFLNVDHFYMSEPTFRPHPHAGFSAVTVLFEDSKGSFVNRDSKGDKSIIRPGDLHWTTAASGIVHEEVPETPGVAGHGLQIFCNLPISQQQAPAKADKLHAEDVAVYTSDDGSRVRVLAGSTNGVSSPLNPHLLTPVTLLDAHLKQGSTFTHHVSPLDNAVVMVIQGQVEVNGKLLSKDDACDFDLGGEVLNFKGVSQDISEFVLLSGKPLGQPVVWRGSFCGSSLEQVAGYIEAYQAGKMGSLAASF